MSCDNKTFKLAQEIVRQYGVKYHDSIDTAMDSKNRFQCRECYMFGQTAFTIFHTEQCRIGKVVMTKKTTCENCECGK